MKKTEVSDHMDILEKDIKCIVKKRYLFEELKGQTVLVTGATGFIGSLLVKALVCANDAYDLKMKIKGQVRNIDKAHKIYGDIFDRIEFSAGYDVYCDHIIHTVSPTRSKYFIEHPVETINASVDSLYSVLETARGNNASVVYLSSMEQYGIPYKTSGLTSEEETGIIDHMNIRSSYSESKRLCECLCVSYASEFGLDIKIARLAQTFGAGAPMNDNRMPMQFAKAAAEGTDIVLHSSGDGIINFVYITDAITGILTVLSKGEKAQAYNVCNDSEHKTVKEIAKLVAENVADNTIGVRVEIDDNMGYAPPVKMRLSSKKLQLLGWRPEVGLTESYKRTVEYIKYFN